MTALIPTAASSTSGSRGRITNTEADGERQLKAWNSGLRASSENAIDRPRAAAKGSIPEADSPFGWK